MKPFTAPANANDSPAIFPDPVTVWLNWPAAAMAAGFEMVAQHWRFAAVVQAAALGGLAAAAPPGAAPAVACAAADVREAGEALRQAQQDAMAALRLSA